MTWNDFELQQYQALRDEILRAMEDGNQVMSFGLAAIGIVLGAAVAEKDSWLGYLLFAGLIPGLSGLVLSMWFAAHERIGRASYYLTGVEARVKRALAAADRPSWECWLRTAGDGRSSRHHFWNTEYSGIGILVFLMLAPLYFSLAAGGYEVAQGTKIVVVGLVTIAIFVFAVALRRRIDRWKGWLCTLFEDNEGTPAGPPPASSSATPAP